MSKDEPEYMDELVPKPQFRGWFIPAEIIAIWQKREITDKELLLLAIIDSLVKFGDKHRGCFASNEYLAKQIGLRHPRSVSNLISSLCGMGLLREVSFDGRRRYLETAWSRIHRRKPKNG